jgi:hypothetical protein
MIFLFNHWNHESAHLHIEIRSQVDRSELNLRNCNNIT